MTTLQEKRTALVKGVLGEDRYQRLIRRYTRSRQRPRIGRVDFGDLASTEPICREFGNFRGRPLDRYYIESFLAANATLITGRVLEVGERLYTEQFGRNVAESDMCNYFDIPDATYVADLTDAPQIPDGTYRSPPSPRTTSSHSPACRQSNAAGRHSRAGCATPTASRSDPR